MKSEALQAALTAALGGKVAPLEDLLCRYGGGADPRPNLKLAAAFGAETPNLPPTVTRLLARFSAEDAAPDTARVFLPIAAAHGWMGRLRAGLDVEQAWLSLAELAADERVPVRLGTLDALNAFVLRKGGADVLIGRAREWLDGEDRERSFGSAALVIETFADRQALAAVGDARGVLDYLSRVLEAVASAPRSAERSDSRRRLLLALPRTLTAAVISFSAADRGSLWLEEECVKARHPDIRAVLSDSILKLRGQESPVVAQRLRGALEGSAKPLRDPSRKRPGTDRGRASRKMK
ncbi:MAG TPA: hypothetical protein VGP07_06370 [Polyangia bacterium]